MSPQASILSNIEEVAQTGSDHPTSLNSHHDSEGEVGQAVCSFFASRYMKYSHTRVRVMNNTRALCGRPAMSLSQTVNRGRTTLSNGQTLLKSASLPPLRVPHSDVFFNPVTSSVVEFPEFSAKGRRRAHGAHSAIQLSWGRSVLLGGQIAQPT